MCCRAPRLSFQEELACSARVCWRSPACSLLALPASAQTVDELIAKNMAARGGMDKLKAVKTMRLTGTMTVGPGMEAPVILETKRPKNMRMEFTLQGMTGVQAFDGTTAWIVMPFMGKKDPEPIPPEEAKDAAKQADFDGPLVDYTQKGHKVEFVGKDKVEGTDAYKLKVTLKSGDIRYVYLDASTSSRSRARVPAHAGHRGGVRVVHERLQGGGRDDVPPLHRERREGQPQKQKMTIEKIEVNPPIDDSRFKMPEVPKARSKPERQLG